MTSGAGHWTGIIDLSESSIAHTLAGIANKSGTPLPSTAHIIMQKNNTNTKCKWAQDHALAYPRGTRSELRY